jgi:hypothetical protein
MIFKLLKAKMHVLEESIKEKFTEYLYAAGGGTDPLGLASLIPDDPTTGTLGGINRATETQWRTSSYAFAGALNARTSKRHLMMCCSISQLKSDKPDLILVRSQHLSPVSCSGSC